MLCLSNALLLLCWFEIMEIHFNYSHPSLCVDRRCSLLKRCLIVEVELYFITIRFIPNNACSKLFLADGRNTRKERYFQSNKLKRKQLRCCTVNMEYKWRKNDSNDVDKGNALLDIVYINIPSLLYLKRYCVTQFTVDR